MSAEPAPAEGSAFQYPQATLKDFDDSVPEDEREFCIARFADLNRVRNARMHCTACNKHLGLSAHNISKLQMHPMLRTLICSDCLEFYNSGEFIKGDDGSELYCRWCGQGGQVYCCAECPVVFCENCIKRNFGQSKIDVIESIENWNCFICDPKSLWCHRAALWAARRYCTLKKKLALTVQDLNKRLQLQKECQFDESICCKKKMKPVAKQKSIMELKKLAKSGTSKKPDNDPQKAIKRIGSPVTIKKISSQPPTPQAILANLSPNLSLASPSSIKKIAISSPPGFNLNIAKQSPFSPRIQQTYPRKQLGRRPNSNQYFPSYPIYNGMIGSNCYNNIGSDNVNLSLENLTQGLDVSDMHQQMQQMNQIQQINPSYDDNVVCTPDFPMPLEPVCEVMEGSEVDIRIKDTTTKVDDDVQCLTPTPKITPKPLSALTEPRKGLLKNLDINPSNIIQMTEKDVTINKTTGGLKFRVDPATLNTNKMYQLPDGRVFAVNINPKMPGGYSATIVVPNESSLPLMNRPRLTVRAPISQTDSSETMVTRSRRSNSSIGSKHSWTTPVMPGQSKTTVNDDKTTSKRSKKNQSEDSNGKLVDNDNVEWFTYNLYNALDFINYISGKLNKLKTKNASNLRSKSIQEIKDVHFKFEQALKVTCQRFVDLRKSLNDDFKSWLKNKYSVDVSSDDDDGDNVEITSDNLGKKDPGEVRIITDEPIFIDENSNDSVKCTEPSENADKELDNCVPITENEMCIEYKGEKSGEASNDKIEENENSINVHNDDSKPMDEAHEDANSGEDNNVESVDNNVVDESQNENANEDSRITANKSNENAEEIMEDEIMDDENSKTAEKKHEDETNEDDISNSNEKVCEDVMIDDDNAAMNASKNDDSVEKMCKDVMMEDDNAAMNTSKNDDSVSFDNLTNLEESCEFRSENSNSNSLITADNLKSNDYHDLEIFSRDDNIEELKNNSMDIENSQSETSKHMKDSNECADENIGCVNEVSKECDGDISSISNDDVAENPSDENFQGSSEKCESNMLDEILKNKNELLSNINTLGILHFDNEKEPEYMNNVNNKEYDEENSELNMSVENNCDNKDSEKGGKETNF